MKELDRLPTLLRDLNRALRDAGDGSLASLVQRAMLASDADRLAFLTSNELWGGAGSIADQAGINCGQEARRRIEKALIALGEEQLKLGVLNPRTASWTSAFSAWHDGSA